ncbi:hypothetical protein BS78_03G275500 [Paspalum vaginatum]|nr:hypothetical protein BS78_03G275500 [Paspalum vaginatum]
MHARPRTGAPRLRARALSCSGRVAPPSAHERRAAGVPSSPSLDALLRHDVAHRCRTTGPAHHSPVPHALPHHRRAKPLPAAAARELHRSAGPLSFPLPCAQCRGGRSLQVEEARLP